MRHILLSSRKGLKESALVDEEDFERVNQYKWHIQKSGWYAAASIKQGYIFMHRMIMSTPKGMDTDHINGNTLDNRKVNLRIVNHSENTKNRTRLNKNNSTGATGVYWIAHIKKWGVRFRKDYKLIYLGSYATKEEAIIFANNQRQNFFDSQYV